MTDDDMVAPVVAAAERVPELFDGTDVEADGDDVPDGDELTPDEIASIRASQADPSTSPPDAEAN